MDHLIWIQFLMIYNWTFSDDIDNSPWPQPGKNQPNRYTQSSSTIYQPAYNVEKNTQGLKSHLKYSIPNKYYDICSHKGCRNGGKSKSFGIYTKPWPRQLLNNRIDYHEENKEDDPEYLAKMVRIRFLLKCIWL